MCSSRVVRGGSWNNNARNTRSANRNNNGPGNRNNDIGLRLTRWLASPELGLPRGMKVCNVSIQAVWVSMVPPTLWRLASGVGGTLFLAECLAASAQPPSNRERCSPSNGVPLMRKLHPFHRLQEVANG